MKNSDKIRAQFEERFEVPSGMRWEPKVGPSGDYVLDCSGCCSGDRAARYIARWEAWQASRERLCVTNRFPSRWATRMLHGPGRLPRNRCGPKG
jgi:hypothetical protein